MSDMELTEYLSEDELSSDKELIAVVRVNRFLYDKTEKLYANVNVKTAAWIQVGASLTHPLEGPAAEKRFYALRQRFGKERRKVVQSMPRSGAGADQPTYTPTWVLYKDLTFLEDIIKPRKTSSNYKSKAVRTSSSVQCTPAPSDSQVTVLCTIPPSLLQAQTRLVRLVLGIGTCIQDSQILMRVLQKYLRIPIRHLLLQYYLLQHHLLQHYLLQHYLLQHYLLQHYLLQHYLLQHYLFQHYLLQHQYLQLLRGLKATFHRCIGLCPRSLPNARCLYLIPLQPENDRR
ncbi:uncharacterized protein LOC143904724 [Temnothorax americanus]|uniref:uncharacterized protein LOC143902342 n=1 Tax=Temnothorax americanus TaxID=1964332 RepID=UPI0040681B8B